MYTVYFIFFQVASATATRFGLSRGLLGLQYDQINLFSSHISFLMADANAIYLSPKPYDLLLINTLRIILSSLLFTTHRLSLFLFLFSFWFSSHISFFDG